MGLHRIFWPHCMSFFSGHSWNCNRGIIWCLKPVCVWNVYSGYLLEWSPLLQTYFKSNISLVPRMIWMRANHHAIAISCLLKCYPRWNDTCDSVNATRWFWVLTVSCAVWVKIFKFPFWLALIYKPVKVKHAITSKIAHCKGECGHIPQNNW